MLFNTFVQTTISSTKECFLHSAVEEVKATTDYGRPLAPREAMLLRAEEHRTEFCCLQWTHNYSQDIGILYYKVGANF